VARINKKTDFNQYQVKVSFCLLSRNLVTTIIFRVVQVPISALVEMSAIFIIRMLLRHPNGDTDVNGLGVVLKVGIADHIRNLFGVFNGIRKFIIIEQDCEFLAPGSIKGRGCCRHYLSIFQSIARVVPRHNRLLDDHKYR